jgi:hypothetical protein
MGITEVCSPISRKGSKLSSGQPLSPGARSDPSVADRRDSVPSQPKHGTASRHSTEPEPSLHRTPHGMGPGEE